MHYQEIVSPCISVCKLNTPDGYCQGCWRTRAEIAGWKKMLDDEKRQVLRALHERRESAGATRPRRTNRRRSTSEQPTGSTEV